MDGDVRVFGVATDTWRHRSTYTPLPLCLPLCSSRTEKWRRRTAGEYGRGARAPPRRRAQQPRPAQQASARRTSMMQLPHPAASIGTPSSSRCTMELVRASRLSPSWHPPTADAPMSLLSLVSHTRTPGYIHHAPNTLCFIASNSADRSSSVSGRRGVPEPTQGVPPGPTRSGPPCAESPRIAAGPQGFPGRRRCCWRRGGPSRWSGRGDFSPREALW